MHITVLQKNNVSMKKILVLVIFILASMPGICEVGSGTFLSPWSGTLAGNSSWSGTVYINGDIIVDNEILTINPGTKVIFLAVGADLIITGTGQLTADGTPSNMITFTADFNNNGIYGQAGERWGHISFESMTSAGPSLINNCIIEWGDVRSAALPNRYGGGIHSAFSNLTISHCIIRNNTAGWGGGIFVNKNSSPAISNCYIQNNSSSSSGGGLYIWSNSASVVTNCIISNNASTSSGGGGGVFLGDLCGNVLLYNCTIVNNTSSTVGQNIHLYVNTNPARPSFINCIIWNPANSITYNTQTPKPSDFINCAIQNPTAGSTTSSITLNALNDDPAGPNFVATNGSDWSIKFISPGRDAGTSIGAPATDFLGNTRVGPYDIGAYEVQYNGWKTTASSTDWATLSNWDGGVPTNISDVIIPTGATNYPTGSTTQAFTIGAGKQMIIKPGAKATLGTLTNNGTLKLESDATNISSLITSNSVNAIVELFLTGGGTQTDYKWHYISTPVSTLPVSTFTDVTNDVVTYAEPRVSTDLSQGWIGHDGWIYSTPEVDFDPTYAFTDLTPGKGYDYWDQLDNKFTFSGSLNVTNQAMALSYSGTANSGFNLLGNPFSSGLNWNDILTSPYPLNTSKGIYFTRSKVQCSYIGGVGIPIDVNGIIPPMQGFFVKTYATGNIINLAPAARTHTGIHPRYKGVEIIPLVRLSTTENGISDETVVRFDNLAKSGEDFDFDAIKMFISPTSTQLYSSLNGTNYAINGLPFPATFVEIPIVVNLLTTGNNSISTTELQGLDNYSVTLTDKTTRFIANLKTTPVLSFSATAGLIADRFILKIGTITTGKEDLVSSSGTFNIYSSFGSINIQTIADEWDGKSGSVSVLDVTGKVVTNLENAYFSKNSLINIPATVPNGIYMVELRAGVKRYVGKVVVR